MREKFRFHVLGMPHCPTTREHSACAYTQKVFRFCKMMHRRGHTVYHYGVEGSDPPCTEHVTCLPYMDQFKNHDWKRSYYPVDWGTELPYWVALNVCTAAAIERRKQPKDILCLIAGMSQKPVSDKHPQLMAVEYGIGYYGTWAPYRCYESYAHMANCYGRASTDPDGRFYDAVIPNYFDVEDFPPIDKPSRDYVLFVGRMIKRKGLEIAVRACERAGIGLVMAGQGAWIKHAEETKDELLCTDDGQSYPTKGLEYVGHIDPKRRAELMSNALCLMAPTLYLEPFGGVAVEAQLCGTPVITTDWGAFPETCVQGKTGYRCHTLQEFTDAIEKCKMLDREAIRARAVGLYSLDVVGQMYDNYFARLQTLWGKGWDA